MNKYITIGIILVVVLAGGILYRTYLLPESSKPVSTGKVREITITAEKNEWRFAPDTIEIERGDLVKMTAINEDDYDHGIAIDAFGISQRMPANSTITFEFVATQAGDFQYYCSVPCGEGETEGEHRTHFDMIGTITVKDVVKTE
ncbi:MAG: hypothetical protein A3J55_00495 [Candidatus Ryanbacteria bacterium RIFCSPHIGHO2_02_FULL_45_17b]|uniref:EfeO-type cupredoxin-like domain-containing protein n=1 Tax=Candidatus Ryanbacteria bacterium RIFCSPHIGHO2_01_FULL_45_22 TaxID=1802114 RepID=A0A1G2G1B7_9BACT|nr:MAG: hypothetical protein A2719_02960 [Candidatus Ryanbacteria bacterium RIFCSPHIGHO2_01_FULL_45_22]OGZ47021.1 MAG: hypothetical protein A3J55_00495 [Candidatus Ryanbacteria bacterium RIFCSPHIGHO2_02_FULL_45_17b]